MSLIIQRMSSFVKWQEYDVLSVRNGSLEGKTLPFEIREQKRIENLPFFLKVNNIFIIMKWTMNAGIFLSFKQCF